MKKSKGYRSQTRSLLRRKPREKGKMGLSRLLQNYAHGDRVCVKINPAVHKGMPHRKFQGRIGVVKGTRGRSYVVEVVTGGKRKQVIARPEHLERHRGED